MTPRTTLSSFLAAALAATILACGGGSGAAGSSAAQKIGDLGAPALSATGSTATTITIEVCAADTGAPAGFSLQWAAVADPADAWPETTCGASFSGNAKDSRYALAAGECVEVEAGAFVQDAGFSTDCGAPLVCGTTYLFRAFAHATNDYYRSDFTTPIDASTAACEPEECTLTQGYWKTHAEALPDALALGERTYTKEELLSVLWTEVEGNGLLTLAHQLAAAKLNGLAGATTEDVEQAIADADALIGALVAPPVGEDWLATADTSDLVDALAAFNQGEAGLPHCE